MPQSWILRNHRKCIKKFAVTLWGQSWKSLIDNAVVVQRAPKPALAKLQLGGLSNTSPPFTSVKLSFFDSLQSHICDSPSVPDQT